MNTSNYLTCEQMWEAIRTGNFSRGPLSPEAVRNTAENRCEHFSRIREGLEDQLDYESDPEKREEIERDLSYNKAEQKFWNEKAGAPAAQLPAARPEPQRSTTLSPPPPPAATPLIVAVVPDYDRPL